MTVVGSPNRSTDVKSTEAYRRSFHVVTVGWGPRLRAAVFERIAERAPYTFSHILVTSGEREPEDARSSRPGTYWVRENVSEPLPRADPVLLASLEGPGVPTIHNMILSDRVMRTVAYDEALRYATLLAVRLDTLYRKLEPSVVIGAYDSLHGGMALAVAKRLGIPWLVMQFTTLPKGFSCFCSGMTPDTDVRISPPSLPHLRAIAEATLRDFEQRALAVPAVSSANNTAMILRRLPMHARAFSWTLKRTLTRTRDKFIECSPQRLCREYVRKRWNLYTLPTRWFCTGPPRTPYVFFGFHLQPESSIDVWAPYYSNQFAVVEAIARSTPPTHRVLVKLHKSDADHYSRGELDRLRRLPGVTIVSPFVPSRDFIEGASLVFVIQGTIGVEAALLGKPVLTFGASKIVEFPSVSKVHSVTDLPALIRAKLSESRPEREAIVRGLMGYLSNYAETFYNDWQGVPSADEIDALVHQFEALHAYLGSQQVAPK